MGAPIQWTTDVMECLHITEVKYTFHATNHCNFKEQCVRILDWWEQVRLFDLFCEFVAKDDPTLTSPVDVFEPTPELILTSQHPMLNFLLKGLVILEFPGCIPSQQNTQHYLHFHWRGHQFVCIIGLLANA